MFHAPTPTFTRKRRQVARRSPQTVPPQNHCTPGAAFFTSESPILSYKRSFEKKPVAIGLGFSPRTRARGSRRVVAAHLCAHEWDSWIRWRCAVDGAARRARHRNDLISSPFDRAFGILCERFGSAARRQRFARSDRESRKFEFASADNYIRDGGAELHRHGLSQEGWRPTTD